MSKSNFLENAVIDHVLRGVAFPALGTNVFVALFTAAPSDAGGGTEVTGGGYARVAVARATTAWAAPADNAGSQQTSNSAAITFPTPTANWGTVTHIAVMATATGTTANDYLYTAALGTSRTINNGDTAPSFAVGALTVAEG
jgi:hypothetical protein